MEAIPVFPDYVPILPNVIADGVRRFAAREFLVEGATRLSFQDAERASAHLARGLLSLGVGKATRIALVLPNGPDWVLAWLAAARIGALTLPLSTLFQPRELDWALREADVHTLFIASQYAGHDYLERIERAVPGLAGQRGPSLFLRSHPYLRHIVVWGECDRKWAVGGAPALRAMADANPAIDDAFLRGVGEQVHPSDLLIGICTSGSTAQPKIVLHTHGGFVRITRAYCDTVLGVKPDERNYAGMPLFWLGGFNCNLMPVMYKGACMVFPASSSPQDVLDMMLREKVTRVMMWPTQYKPLMDLAAERGVDIRAAMAMQVPRPGINAPPPERRIRSLLGMTECFGPHGFGDWEEELPEGSGGSDGRNVRGIERKVVDPQTRRELPPGEQGELMIRGFSLMDGYYKRERATVFDADGWFATGDNCRIDAGGHLFFNGRLGDMIKTAGANVAPQEVEALMLSYPGVAEAIVVGLPDAERGERVVAVVIPRLGETVDTEAMRRRMQGDISSYKVPRQIVLMKYDDVPRTAAAKVLRAPLKAQLAAMLG
jgi:acyl-CoA synthetase (AMP-forming)/AMP-acid ligase II